jgi:DNA topoisomerase IB
MGMGMSIINQHDWEILREQFQNADPFPSLCIDNFLEENFARKLAQSYPDFTTAQTQGLEFRAVNEKRKVQITNPEHFPTEVKQLHEALASENFIQTMRDLSGIEDLSFDPSFSGGGMHMTDSSGKLDVHVDFNYSEELNRYRRLNILIYLNEDWQEDWGGNVEIWDKNVKHCAASFSPVLNRCVMFATSDISFHGVTAVTSPTGIARKSFAIYLYSKDPAAAMSEEHYSTIFKARPDEKAQKYLWMPAESIGRFLKEQWERVARQLNKLK